MPNLPGQTTQAVSTFVEDLFSRDTWLGALFYGILFLAAAWLVGRAVRLAVHRLLDRDIQGALDRTTIRFLAQLARLCVYIFAFICYAHVITPLNKLGTAWLASVGVVSVVVGLAAQNTLGNLIAGISLVLYRPFKIGDSLQLSGPSGLETGVVESINLGYTVLRTADNRQLVMPNSLIANQASLNLRYARPQCALTVKLEYDADTEKARQIMAAVADKHPNSLGNSQARFAAVGADGLAVALIAWPRDPKTIDDMRSDLLESIKKQFQAAGIQFYREAS